ncbi:EI24 domain-containing protein [Nocardioides lianchengensis]|uniref:EI24 domain-containing protein n=1 Tax=Nocardioides lianchengensis TaxID=1045774 RepID=UPI000B86F425|nr:EI24 domain-containing protein [Nocardioides lianchengensis]NYG12347.1 CysZ protein [Nocardioides lianchengensis]
MSGPVGVAHGASYVLQGFSMWRRRPGLMLLGMVPALIVLVLVTAALVALLLTVGDLVAWLTPFADDWGGVRTLLRVGLALLLVGGAVLLASVTFTGLTLAIGDPFYERIWRETERMIGGEVPEGGVGFWRSLRDAGGLMLAGVGMALVLAVIGFLPLVGAVVGAVLGFVVSARLLAGELVSRPLESRGLDRAARQEVLAGHGSSVLGLGLATQAFFLVPFGAVAVMPAAVVGSTMLVREILDGRDGGVVRHTGAVTGE